MAAACAHVARHCMLASVVELGVRTLRRVDHLPVVMWCGPSVGTVCTPCPTWPARCSFTWQAEWQRWRHRKGVHACIWYVQLACAAWMFADTAALPPVLSVRRVPWPPGGGGCGGPHGEGQDGVLPEVRPCNTIFRSFRQCFARLLASSLTDAARALAAAAPLLALR